MASETMKMCEKLNLPFVIPTYIVQDASYSESNAAELVFGPTIKIVMCWFHMLFNVKNMNQ